MIKVIAHRGASGMVGQDNTLESFQKAIEIGADMVEFDVRQTKDKVLIVHHDKNFADTPIAWQTYSNIEKEAKLRGIHLPLFREVVELCHGKIYMDIEIKEHGFEKKIVKELHKLADVSEYSVKSFDDRVPYAIRKLDPEIKTGLLIGGTKFKLKKRFNELFPIRRLKACKADFVSKLSIALKEASETSYWLVVLNRADFLDEKLYLSLKADVDEIIRILVASIKTTKKNMV